MESPSIAAASRSAWTSDEEIVDRVRAGEVALFEVLMRRHNQRIYRTVRAIVRDEAEVEDAMQQAYLAAYTNLRSFEGSAAFSTWLTRIAINEALGRLRRSARLTVAEAPVEDAEPLDRAPPQTPEEGAAARESLALIEAAVDRLPAPYRSVYMLREVQELSTAECADVLGITEETVKIRLHRARAALREALAKQLGRVAPEAFPFPATRCDRVVAGVMARILTSPH
jgi:RNA polymerase sigma-70 factor (ECF subfamily)